MASRAFALADAVGHSVLVFAFLPALAPVPHWLAFEAQNPLNYQDPVVLIFLPIRGAVLLLNVFWQGALLGVAAGCSNGLLLCAATYADETPPPRLRAMLFGAATGTAAATMMVLTIVTLNRIDPTKLDWSGTLFELTSGLVCGALSAPKALALWLNRGQRIAQNGVDARRDRANAEA